MSVWMVLFQEAWCEGYLVEKFPQETIAIALPNHEHANWKELNRDVTEKAGIVERIPCSQTPRNWNELLAIQYFDGADWDKKTVNSVEYIVGKIQETTLAAYPGKKITWNIIEKNSQDLIYEWILHETHQDIPPQHEISRAILTKTGFHRIGITHKNTVMSSEVRSKWLSLLKNNVSVIPLELSSHNHSELSMLDQLQNSLDLEVVFPQRKIEQRYVTNNGCIKTRYGFLEQNIANIKENLEVVTATMGTKMPLQEIFQIEKSAVQKQTSAKLSFQVLKKSSSEIIYSYSYPKEGGRLTSVVRTVRSDKGYYSIRYQQEGKLSMAKEDVLYWKERLELVQLKNNLVLTAHKKVGRSVPALM